MKQLFSLGGEIVVEEVPTPTCGAGEVLVQNMFSVISTGTESAAITGSSGGIGGLIAKARENPELVQRGIDMVKREGLTKTLNTIRGQEGGKPIPLGYSSSGVVLELGKDITDISIGDRIACAGAGYANHAEITTVPRNLICNIPDGVDFNEAAFTTLGAISMQGIRRAQVQLGDKVVVIGLGLIGQIACQILKACGAFVIGIDPVEERVRLAGELGLDVGLVSRKDVVSQVLGHTGGSGADAVIICAASSSSEPVRQAMQMARKKGRVVVVGAVGMELKRSPFYEKELDFLISCSYGPGRYDPEYEVKGRDYPAAYVRWTENRNMQAFLDLLAKKKVDVRGLIEYVFPIEEAREAYRVLTDNDRRPVAVLLEYEAQEKVKIESPRLLELKSLEKVTGKINVGVIGAGGFARAYHLPNLARIPFYNIRAVVTRTAVNAKRVAEKFNAQYCTTDFQEVLGDKDIDMVIIATRHNLHAPLICEAVASGKHIFVEKPVALTYEQCKQVYEATSNGRVSIAVGFNRRFSPLAQKAKRLVDKRRSPMVISYRINSAGVKKEHWINDPEEGGGAIVGEACHFFDFVSWLVGAEPGRIYSEMISSQDPSVVDANNIVCTVSYEDGSIASLVYNTIGNELFGKERIEIFMDGGVIAIEDFREMKVNGLNTKGEKLSRVEKGQLVLLQEYGKFLRGEGRNDDLPSISDGIRATVCSLKVLDALRTGDVQEFEYPW